MKVLLEIGICVLLVILELVVVALICNPKGVIRGVRRLLRRRSARHASHAQPATSPRW